ncbi:hypothetical protein QOZ80_8BG0661130 [Eleusine coracana subsp. coracana]|nr:hypothetical protein QOZ80_8BG0661130 [Eleusine coracana subsp. coracana]
MPPQSFLSRNMTQVNMVEGEGFVLVGATTVSAPAANGGPRPPMRWSPANSGFVLRAICELVGKGARSDKGFKEVLVNQVAKALREFSGEEVEFYTEMETAFGSTMATNRFATGFGEALGQFSGFGDSEGAKTDFANIGGQDMADATDTLKATTEANTCGLKRKRSCFSKHESLLMSNMTDVVNNVASALRETAPSYVDLDLYDVVMGALEFNEEALMVAYNHMLDNKAHGRGYINMTSAHRVLWLRTWLSKHYFV